MTWGAGAKMACRAFGGYWLFDLVLQKRRLLRFLHVKGFSSKLVPLTEGAWFVDSTLTRRRPVTVKVKTTRLAATTADMMFASQDPAFVRPAGPSSTSSIPSRCRGRRSFGLADGTTSARRYCACEFDGDAVAGWAFVADWPAVRARTTAADLLLRRVTSTVAGRRTVIAEATAVGGCGRPTPSAPAAAGALLAAGARLSCCACGVEAPRAGCWNRAVPSPSGRAPAAPRVSG